MSDLIASNQTVSRGVYGIAIREACRVPEEFISAHTARIDLAYKMGEPIQMIVDELLFRYAHRPQATKTAAQLAVRVVRVSR
jgi:hypothetical protein